MVLWSDTFSTPACKQCNIVQINYTYRYTVFQKQAGTKSDGNWRHRILCGVAVKNTKITPSKFMKSPLKDPRISEFFQGSTPPDLFSWMRLCHFVKLFLYIQLIHKTRARHHQLSATPLLSIYLLIITYFSCLFLPSSIFSPLICLDWILTIWNNFIYCERAESSGFLQFDRPQVLQLFTSLTNNLIHTVCDYWA